MQQNTQFNCKYQAQRAVKTMATVILIGTVTDNSVTQTMGINDLDGFNPLLLLLAILISLSTRTTQRQFARRELVNQSRAQSDHGHAPGSSVKSKLVHEKETTIGEWYRLQDNIEAVQIFGS